MFNNICHTSKSSKIYIKLQIIETYETLLFYQIDKRSHTAFITTYIDVYTF